MNIVFAGEQHAVPAGAVVGCVGFSASGVGDLLRAAGGRYLGPLDPLDLSPAPVIAADYTLDAQDAPRRLSLGRDIERLRRAGSRLLLASHDTRLLAALADELWWIDAGAIRARGAPSEVLKQFDAAVFARVRESLGAAVLDPAMRRGDGRARLLAIETFDAAGAHTTVWNSGDEAEVRVRVRFEAQVPDPVVGIMLRTRIGMEVYGTNTELEALPLGPCAPGDIAAVSFRFRCDLCPGHYSLTAASHDPDGVWHDWLEDAVAFTVAGTRYTAGVANLRARATCSRE